MTKYVRMYITNRLFTRAEYYKKLMRGKTRLFLIFEMRDETNFFNAKSFKKLPNNQNHRSNLINNNSSNIINNNISNSNINNENSISINMNPMFPMNEDIRIDVNNSNNIHQNNNEEKEIRETRLVTFKNKDDSKKKRNLNSSIMNSRNRYKMQSEKITTMKMRVRQCLNDTSIIVPEKSLIVQENLKNSKIRKIPDRNLIGSSIKENNSQISNRSNLNLISKLKYNDLKKINNISINYERKYKQKNPKNDLNPWEYHRSFIINKTRNFLEIDDNSTGFKINTEKITCEYIRIYQTVNEKPIIEKTNTRACLKYVLAFIILIPIYIYMLFMIKDVYDKYGQSFFKLCIMPLISTILIQFLIVKNIIFTIASVVSYYYGKHMNMIKQKTFKKIIYDMLVPISVTNNLRAIHTYQQIMK